MAHLRIKRALAGLLAVWALCGAAALAAEPEPSFTATGGHNIVLALDTSGSMGGMDPDHQGREAAAAFVESLYHAAVEGMEGLNHPEVSIGALSFNTECTPVLPMTNLQSESDVAAAMAAIRNIRYAQNGVGTDIGQAVLESAKMIRGLNKTRRNVVILFTDGYTDGLAPGVHETRFPPAVNEPIETDTSGESGNPYDQSRQRLYNGMKIALEQNCEIFVIGFDKNGNMTEIGRKWIAYISGRTQQNGIIPRENGEPVNYLVTNSMREVREFYVRLIASVVQGKEPYRATRTTNPDRYNIELDSGVSRAVIHVLSDAGTPKLFTPKEVESDAPLYSMAGYMTFVLTNPLAGSWYLRFEEEQEAEVLYVLTDGVQIQPSVRQNGGEGVVTVHATFRGSPADPSLYQSVQAVCTVFPPDAEGQAYEFLLPYDEAALAWVGSFYPDSPAGYSLRVTARSKSAQWQTQADAFLRFQMKFQNGETIRLYQGDTLTVSLSRFLPNWKNISVTSDDQAAASDIITTALTSPDQNGAYTGISIHGDKVGETNLRIRLTDDYRNEAEEIEVKVIVDPVIQRNAFSMENISLSSMLTFAFVLLLVLAAIVAVKVMNKLKGERDDGPRPPSKPEEIRQITLPPLDSGDGGNLSDTHCLPAENNVRPGDTNPEPEPAPDEEDEFKPEGAFNVTVRLEGFDPVRDEVRCPPEESFPLYALTDALMRMARTRDWPGTASPESVREVDEILSQLEHDLSSRRYLISRERPDDETGYVYFCGGVRLDSETTVYEGEGNGLEIVVSYWRFVKDSVA